MNQRLFTREWDDYELVDAGDKLKLERWGQVLTIRPEINAYFKPDQTLKLWREQADWEFVETGTQSGVWQALKENAPRQWQISYGNLRLQLGLTHFKHIGLFPEQRTNWDYIADHLPDNGRFLNIFAYTGAASCIARQTGAETLHIDSVKQLISWAHQNMQLSGLYDIKWVREDALKFVERELKRGKSYDGIIMDPPAWGIGAKGEKWKLEHQLETLLANAQALLAPNGFLILNTYSPTISLQDINHLAQKYFEAKKWVAAELWMKTRSGKDLYYGNLLRAVK